MALTEEQLLAALETEPFPCAEWITELDALHTDGKEMRALEWAELIKDTLTDRKQLDDAIAVYEWMAMKQGTSAAIAKKELAHIVGNSRKEMRFIEPAFEKARTAEEAFCRLRHLRSMQKGMLCMHPTWGFGVIARIDPFYQKVEVEFETRGDHELAFSYAAETLETLDDDHVLTVRHNRPDEFARIVTEDPAELVRMMLRSYGPLSAQSLQDRMVPELLASPAEWKKFWEGARAGLKADPLVELPSRRSEPIRLRRKAKAYDAEWANALKAECDVPMVFKLIDELIAQNLPQLDSVMTGAVADRLAFAIQGGAINQPRWIAHALVLAERLGVDPAGVDTSAEFLKLAERDDFTALLEDLPAKSMQAFVHRLFSETDSAAAILLERIPQMGMTALNETLDALIRNGGEEALSAAVREAARKRECSPALLVWIWRNDERAGVWGVCDPATLAFQTVEAIEEEVGGAALRAQNQLRTQLEDVETLKRVLAAMNDSQRRDFMRRITESPAWSKLDRQSLQAKLIKLCPDLHDVVLRKSASAPQEGKPRLTSKRSYQERKDQFERILKKEIPENSKEIELARSYGDLRENAEYKYAKEKQRLLGLQAEELQKALDQVKPTDFAGFPAERAGIATGVELLYRDGHRETYYILGEWDQDDELHIISCQAGMAKALEGARAGDHAEVPTASGHPVEVEVTAVTPLPEAIRNWIAGGA